MQAIAFFDLDNTLVDGASGSFMFYDMLKAGKVGWSDFLTYFRYTILYSFNRVPRLEVYRWMFRLCSRYSLSELLDMTDRMYEKYMYPRFFEEGRLTVQKHLEKGDHVVILTAATEYLAEKVRAQFGGHHAIGIKTPLRDGKITDDVQEPISYGAGKLQLAGEYSRNRGVSLEDCYFYSDSASDFPLLNAVGHPVMVNPQWKLRWMTRKKGWATLSFREHARFSSPAEARSVSGFDLEQIRQGSIDTI